MEFLSVILDAIIGTIVEKAFAPVGRQIGYFVFYNRNITNLKEEVKKLEDRKSGVKLQVDDAERNLLIPALEVKTWQEKVDDIDEQVTKFFEREITQNRKCFSDLCRNPKSRHSSSRKAVKMNEEVVSLLQEAGNFNQIAFPAPPPALSTMFNMEGVQDFESRLSIMNDVVEALKDDKLTMIAICGQGGVGKTTMVKKLVQIVESLKMFDEVAMAVVSQIPDVERIQGDIASCLGLEFNKENEQERAQKLCERILKFEKRVLVILDDVWNETDFLKIGMPSTSKRMGYKILLTSRKEDECNSMGSQKNFCINALSHQEARDLFKDMALPSSSLDDQDKLQLAIEIADECDGLPIAIVAIAKALKNKGESIWVNALHQLKMSNLEGIKGMEKVYSRLELSYSLLERDEAKSCFLVCSLFPEDYDIPIQDLVIYGMGLGLFENIDSISEARNRVDALIDELKESSMLLHSNKDEDEYVRMHDVLRDVAISIASKKKSYLLRYGDEMKKWPDQWTHRYKDCVGISLVCDSMEKHPIDLECPNLQLLNLRCRYWSQRLPVNFFNGMKELRVLDLDIELLPKSLNDLEKLRTLYLPCLDETLKFDNLRNLEVLVIRDYKFQKLPNEVRLLENLRLLDLSCMTSLNYIAAGVLFKLSKLEELYVSTTFDGWESKVQDDDGHEKFNASLRELESLPLTKLQLFVPEVSMLPEEFAFAKLVRFKIHVCCKELYSIGNDLENDLVLKGDVSDIMGSGICELLKRTENLELNEVKNLEGMYELGDDGFPRLKKLMISHCDKLEQLVDMKKIQARCFSDLKEVSTYDCGELKYLFPASTLEDKRRLSQLQSIILVHCPEMQAIFNGGKKENHETLEFPYLEKMILESVPKLKAFWAECNYYVDHDNPQDSEICALIPSWIRLSNLETLELNGCDSLKVIFSRSATEMLVQLQYLKIESCGQVEYIVASAGGQEEKDTGRSKLVFPKLQALQLFNLPELSAFSADCHVFLDMHSSLEIIEVKGCPKIKTLIGTTQNPSTLNQSLVSIEEVLLRIPSDFKESINVYKLKVERCDNLMQLIFSSHVAKLLMKLRIMEISLCKKMEQIIAKDDEEEETDVIEFLQLESLHLHDLVNLKSFYDGIYTVRLPSLTSLTLDKCESVKIFASSSNAPNLEGMRIGDQYRLVNMGDINWNIKTWKLVPAIMLEDDHLITRIRLDDLTNEDMSQIRGALIGKCDKLLNVIPCNLITNLQNIELVYVEKCRSMEEIFEYRGVNAEEETYATFSHLEKITLKDLTNLMHIFDRIPKSIAGFQKLTILEISGCNNLKNILSVSVARGLVQLKKLDIRLCSGLEEIVSKEETEEGITNEIVFPQLRSISLSYLYSFKSFYSGISALEFPLLQSLSFLECSTLFKSFSNGSLKTPKLQRVEIGYSSYTCDRNLNKLLINKMLETVWIECNEPMARIHQQPKSGIRTLVIAEYSNAVPWNQVASHQNFEMLVIYNCDSVEEIFELVPEEESVAMLSHFGHIWLKRLPKLKHIFNKIPDSIPCFQKLGKLHVEYCDNLRYIFSVPMLRGLPQLEIVKISHCDALEEILVEEDMEEGEGMEKEPTKDKIVFPKLNVFYVSSSPKLQCFYSGICALEFPSLRFLTWECDSTKTFSNGLINGKFYSCIEDLTKDLSNIGVDGFSF